MSRSLWCFVLWSAVMTASAADYDLLVRHGTIIDGTGQAGFVADIGVRDGKIAFIGAAGAATAGRTIDASGLVVAPGFIDTHNHSVDQLLAEDFESRGPVTNEAYLLQGVTTVVGGPDGALSIDNTKRLLRRFAEPWLGTNYAFYAGHNGIRAAVMGSAQRAPTRRELEKMKSQVREAMELGAVGLSSGLMYDPGMFSKPDELIALAREVKPYQGIYDSHVRNPATDLLGSDAEAIEVGRAAGIPVKIAHEKAASRRNFGLMKQIIRMIEAARAEGVEVVTDQYPYDGAATSTLEGIMVLPDHKELSSRRHVSTEEGARALLAGVQEGLRDPARRPRIADASIHGIDGGFSWIKAVGYGAMRIVDSTDYPELVGKNLEVLAQERHQDGFDLIAELILGGKHSTIITLGAVDEPEVRELMVQPWNMICSDGGYVADGYSTFNHPRSTGTFTRVLGHYSRDLKLLALPDAVRKMTSLPADFLHLNDRGRLAVGKAADMAMFDPAKVRDVSTWVRPNLYSEFVLHVVVNGTPVVLNGVVTGATPGQVVRRQTGSPARS